MTNEEDTVQIQSAPRPASMVWLGITHAAAGLSWVVVVATMLINEPTRDQLIATGLCISVTTSIAALAAWNRYTYAKASAANAWHFSQLLAGQHAWTMAQMRRMCGDMKVADGQASADREAMSYKLTKIINDMPTYWHGVADEIEREVEGNVRTLPRRSPGR
jgi:hypothetical protein